MLRAKTIFLLLLLAALPCGAPAARGADANPFSRPPALEDQVRFWIRVYSEVGTQGGFIHDSRDMGVVYEKIEFRPGASRRARERQVKEAKARYDAILATLASGKRTGLGADELRVLALFPDGVSNGSLAAARGRIRFQLGQSDRFRDGVIRAGRWEPHIMQVLADHGVPYELAALPHVESSYNPNAHSHAGAAGLWQFTRSTGRLFMRIDHVVDERMDPYIASVAAARLLLSNHRRTGSWPTAITAYNHGTAGMERAIRKLGTRDIATIVRKYQSRSFGFASRNFYTSFLAAVEVSRNAEHYFGELQVDPAEDLEVVVLDHYYAPATLSRVFGVGEGTLRQYNLALLSPVWGGQKYVPKGYALRFPRQADVSDTAVLLAQVPASERILRQRPDRAYRVHQGDTLSGIARRFGVRESDLMALNGLRNRHRIRIGQRLKLPTDDGPTTVAMVRDQDPNARPRLQRPADGRYVVHRGDTLSGLATTFGVTVEELLAVNDLRNRNRLAVGQVLFIPGDVTPAGGSYVVRRGDTLDRIAARFGVSRRSLEEQNHIRNRNRIRVGQVLTIPGAGPPRTPTRYTVQRGDNLDRIAASHGVTVAAIQQANEIRNRNRIHVGQVLTIPGVGEAAEQPAPTVVAAVRPPEPATPAPVEPERPAPVEPERPAPAPAEARPPGAPGTGAAAEPAEPPPPAGPEADAVAEVLAAADPGADPVVEVLAAADPAPPPTGEVPTDLPWAPRRYRVAPDGSVVVRPEETLGHYADWLGIRTQRLRDLNGLRFGDTLAIGRRIRLDFSAVDRESFERQRLAHHRSLQTAFFDAWSVAGTEQHVLRRGETLWKITRRKHDVPVWLIQQYNPGLDVNALRPGMRIRIPRVEPREKSEA